MRNSFLLICLSVFLFYSCGNEHLAYLHEIQQQKHISKSYSVSTLIQGHVSIILVFDVSASMDKEIVWVAEVIEDALNVLTTTYFKTPWKLAILGSNVATISSLSIGETKIDESLLGKTITSHSPVLAMNFVGFPEEAILEKQHRNEPIDDTMKQYIREQDAPITNKTPNYVQKIKDSLLEVLNWGDLDRSVFRKAGSEEMFYAPVIVSLKRDPSFITPGGHLAVFYFSDVEDQSGPKEINNDNLYSGTSYDPTYPPNYGGATYGGNAWSGITPDQYLNELQGMVGNDISKIFMGGGFSAADLESHGPQICRGENNFVVQGSTFEKLILATAKTQEAIISNCASQQEFQALFIKLFELLSSRIDSPRLLIGDSGVPICTSSIKVYYKDVLLPRGSIESGGAWRFDWRSNLIRFNDMDFIDEDDKEAEVRVEFDMDNGLDDSC